MTSLSPTYEYHEGYVTLPQASGIAEHPPPIRHWLYCEAGISLQPRSCEKLIPQLVTPECDEATATAHAIDAVTRAINDLRPALTGFGEIKIAAQPERGRQTLVITVSVSGLDGVFELINSELKLDQPVQFTHVTLYTLSNRLPIGIASQDEAKKWLKSPNASEQLELTSQLENALSDLRGSS